MIQFMFYMATALGNQTITPTTHFCREVERHSGEKVAACYQCGKCTAGCPAAPFMRGGPRWALRAIQLGLREEVLDSPTIWFCLFCATCSARCPAGIDIPRVLESLRMMALSEKRPPASREVALFHDLLLRQVGGPGRVHELALGGTFNLRSGHPLQNFRLVPWMLRRGKLPLRSEAASARLRGLVARTLKAEEDGGG